MNSAAFDVYYEHLLLLSFWSDVKNEVRGRPNPGGRGMGTPEMMALAIENMNNAQHPYE
jgi:hypothetical protein